MVWPSHVRLSITRHFQALFASAHGEARNTRADHAPKALLFFLSARSSAPGHLFMHSLLVDFARDCFAHRPIDWLACVYALTNCSAFLQAFFGLFRRFSDVRHRLTSQFPSQTSDEEEKAQRNRIIESSCICDNQQYPTWYRRTWAHLPWRTSWRWRRRRHYGMNVTHHVSVLQEIEAEVILLAGATAIAPSKRGGSEGPVQWRLAPAAAPAAAMEGPASPPSAPRGVPPFLGLSAGLWPSSPSAAVRCPRRWPRLSFLVSRPRPWDRLACLDGRLQ